MALEFVGPYADLKEEIYNRTNGNHLDWSDADKIRMVALLYAGEDNPITPDILRIADKLEALENGR